jgi:Zn-finger nucleic acid-binding protein
VESAARAGYRPRDAAASPLYLAVVDHLETYLAERSRAKDDPAGPCAEFSLRAFLQCGVPRFGVARFRCKCGESRFVPFSCKRRLACPSCDAKRAVVESSHALDALLPDAAYRQWVLVLPKRLRYFVHRDPRLAGEIASIFARTLTAYCRRKSGAPRGAAPVQFHSLQRFGSAVNLHLHDHAVVSDGCFALEGGTLKFYRAAPPGVVDIARLLEILRFKIFRRMLRMGAVPEASIREMLTWAHSGFTLDAGTKIESGDRDGLRRLLLYVLRPALSLKKLTYKPEVGLVRYHCTKAGQGLAIHEWTGVEFVRRIAALIPPARKHVVRYYGALGPCSPLRGAVNAATRGKATSEELEAGYSITLVGRATREARKAASAALRSWAACVRKVFEVDPVLCAKCGGEMKLVAVVLDDGELDRILAHQGWPVEFPKTKPSRSPPRREESADAEGQIDPRVEKWDGRDEPSSERPA